LILRELKLFKEGINLDTKLRKLDKETRY